MSIRRISLCLGLFVVMAACGAGAADTTAVAADTPTTLTAPPETARGTAPAEPSPPPPAADQEDDFGLVEDDGTDGAAPTDPAGVTTPAPGEEPVRAPEPVDSTVPDSGEVPGALISAILDHAAETTGSAASDFTVARAEQVVWSDGSLGCPQPGVVYTQALVDGFLVVVEHDVTRLEYHAAASGGFKLCQPSRDKPVAP